MNPFGLIFVAAGACAICGAALDWDFFMNHRKAWILVKMLGRNGARVLYILLGQSVAVLGTLLTLGIIKDAA